MGRHLRDLRISVTDRCNFRCVYCMPRDVFDENYKFLPHAALLSFEEIAQLASVFVGLGVEKIRLTGGEPLVRRDLERLDRAARAARRRPHAHHQRLAAREEGPGAQGRGPQAHHREPRLARRRHVQGDERRRLPGRESARRHRGGRRRGTRAGQGQHGGQARRQRPPGARHGAPFPRHGPHRAVHRVHGRRQHQRLAHGRRDSLGRNRAPHFRRISARAGRPGLPRRGRRALALCRRRGRDRRDLLGDAGLLQRLQPPAPVDRRRDVHLPVRPARPRPAHAAALGRHGRRPARRDRRRSGAPAATGTRRSAPPRPRDRTKTAPKSRCRT